MDSSLVPDVLDKAPSSILTITYPDSLKVAEGNELTPFQSKDQPSVEWKFDTNAFYTLLMIDPDAPSRRFSILGEVNHWLVGNIQGCNIDSGEVIAEYMGPGAPKYTGLHRYIFLLF